MVPYGLRFPQGLEIGKIPVNLFSIILDPSYYQEVHLIQKRYNLLFCRYFSWYFSGTLDGTPAFSIWKENLTQYFKRGNVTHSGFLRTLLETHVRSISLSAPLFGVCMVMGSILGLNCVIGKDVPTSAMSDVRNLQDE